MTMNTDARSFMPNAENAFRADGFVVEEHIGSCLLFLPVLNRDHELAAAAILDHARFEDSVDAILARHGDEVDTYFADSDELLAMGVDIVALAAAYEQGLSREHISALDQVEDGLLIVSHALAIGLPAWAVDMLLDLYPVDDVLDFIEDVLVIIVR